MGELISPSWWLINELFPIRVCLGFQEKLDGLGNPLGTLHPDFSTATLWGSFGLSSPRARKTVS